MFNKELNKKVEVLKKNMEERSNNLNRLLQGLCEYLKVTYNVERVIEEDIFGQLFGNGLSCGEKIVDKYVFSPIKKPTKKLKKAKK